MSIEFNRRTFLKTSAALAGAAALVSLTGCDSSSSSSSHSINKVVTDKPYDVSGLSISPDDEGTIAGTDSSKKYSIGFTLKNSSSSDAKLYNDSATIYYKGNAMQTTVKVSNNPVSFPATIAAGATVELDFSCPVPADAKISDVIIKFHYNDKSIKFQKGSDDKFKTSGVYTDKL